MGSYNGTFFRGRKESTFEISPGDTFNIATTCLVVLNKAMQVARPILTEVLGRDQDFAIDDVLINAVLDDPILIVGPRGAGQSDLTRTIHGISFRRKQPLVEVSCPPRTREDAQQLIDHMQRGTLVLTADGNPFDETFLETMCSPACGARLVLLAPSLQTAMRSVALSRFPSMSRIDIRPLRERPDDVPWLLELNLANNGSSVRLADLRPENRDRLLHHNWPDNLEQLRQIAAIIAALVRQGSIRKAADALEMPRSTMQYRIKRFRLTHPPTSAPEMRPSLESSAT